MDAENKRARAGIPDTGSSPELSASTPTTAQLLEHCTPHLQITKLFLRLTKDECREVLADIRHRHPDLWEVAQ